MPDSPMNFVKAGVMDKIRKTINVFFEKTDNIRLGDRVVLDDVDIEEADWLNLQQGHMEVHVKQNNMKVFCRLIGIDVDQNKAHLELMAIESVL